MHPQRGDPLKAYRHNGASGNAGTGARVPAKPKHSALETGSDLSQQNAWMPQRHTESPTPLLDALFGAYTPAFSPTVGGTQAERYRTASDAEVDAMDPATVRADLWRNRHKRMQNPGYSPGSRDYSMWRKNGKRWKPRAMRQRTSGWWTRLEIIELCPKGQYREDIQEGGSVRKQKITVGGTSTAATIHVRC